MAHEIELGDEYPEIKTDEDFDVIIAAYLKMKMDADELAKSLKRMRAHIESEMDARSLDFYENDQAVMKRIVSDRKPSLDLALLESDGVQLDRYYKKEPEETVYLRVQPKRERRGGQKLA